MLHLGWEGRVSYRGGGPGISTRLFDCWQSQQSLEGSLGRKFQGVPSFLTS